MDGARSLLALSIAAAVVIGSPAGAAEPQRLTVLAAASLSDAFKAIAAKFQATQPRVTVELSFAGSSTLVMQIKEGAPAEVFASADEANMQKAAEAGELAGAAKIFVTNRLTIVVPKGNPKKITSLADLAKPGATVALAAPEVPAGKYAAEIFAKAGVTVTAASREVDVRAVLNKVALDEADAGIVYVTDVRAAAGKVEAVAIPDQYNVTARYPIAVLKDAQDPATATAFVEYLLSPAAQSVLEEFGFQAP